MQASEAIVFSPVEAYEFGLLPLCVWREARGASEVAQRAVAHVIVNRSRAASWWGKDIPSVVLCHRGAIYQFTSFSSFDANSFEFPSWGDPRFLSVVNICAEVYHATSADPTRGATHYYDKSLDLNPPAWSQSPRMVHAIDIDPFHFFRED